jgi:hypothetical protein
MAKRQVQVDAITQRPSDGAYILVLIEQGPWGRKRVETQLRRLQGRLYDYLDIAVDGHLAALHPESKGKPVVIRLDCYDTPDAPIREFMAAFSEHVNADKAIQRAIKTGGLVESIAFEYNWDTLQDEG